VGRELGHRANGTVLAGGECGGSLDPILGPDFKARYQKDMEKVRRADEKNKLKFMEKADRRKRLQNDIEHLESALEAEADLFVTSDFALIGKVKSVPRREVELSPQIRKAQEIICTASEALDRIRSSQAI
ncbi:MAG: hypothetical protein PVG03_14635, partial [Desulfarculaceae bacterium]